MEKVISNGDNFGNKINEIVDWINKFEKQRKDKMKKEAQARLDKIKRVDAQYGEII